MFDKFVRAEWAREAVGRIEGAVSELNCQIHTIVPIRIVWGRANEEEVEAENEAPKGRPFQYGLINCFDLDFELFISRQGDRAHPTLCRLRTRFERPQLLPLTPRELYNVLRCCEDGVSLWVLPNQEPTGILVLGVRTLLPVENLTGRVLYDALSRLRSSHNLAFDQLARGRGDDWWLMDGGT